MGRTGSPWLLVQGSRGERVGLRGAEDVLVENCGEENPTHDSDTWLAQGEFGTCRMGALSRREWARLGPYPLDGETVSPGRGVSTCRPATPATDSLADVTDETLRNLERTLAETGDLGVEVRLLQERYGKETSTGANCDSPPTSATPRR